MPSPSCSTPQAPPTALRLSEPRNVARAGPGSRGRVAESGMASAIPQEQLAEIVRDARARTGVPAVAAGLLVGERIELTADGPVETDTPFRIASITKWFTASLAAILLDLDAPSESGGASVGRLLSHTADLRANSSELLPEACRGLWSYSNAGFVLAGRECAAVAGTSFSEAVRKRLLEPLGLERTSFEEAAALAVLTNSWRGSGLIRRVVQGLGFVPAPREGAGDGRIEPGRYALDDAVAVVDDRGGRWRVTESEVDPLTGLPIERPEYAVDALGGGVYGFAGGLLMGHRLDFPREGVARVGWTALPAAGL